MDHSAHHKDTVLSTAVTALAVGGAVVAGGVILAPYLVPAWGLGEVDMAREAVTALHNAGDAGLAGTINGLVRHIPLIGETLAQGGAWNAAATGVIGMGGALTGNYLSRHHKGKGINWGKVLKWAALATSALIALPSVLTGISNGLIYLASEFGGTEFGMKVIDWAVEHTGTIALSSNAGATMSGAAAVLPHMFTCGLSLLPAFMSFGLGHYLSDQPVAEKEPEHPHADKVQHRHVYKPVNKQLTTDDPNHRLSEEEKAMVEAYNSAPASRKPLLQRKFKEMGFTPDFHADGTMHLHQHTTGMAR